MNATSRLIREEFFVQHAHNPRGHSRHQLVGSVHLTPVKGVNVIIAFIMTAGRPYDPAACPVDEERRKFYFRCPPGALGILIFKILADEYKIRVEEVEKNINIGK